MKKRTKLRLYVLIFVIAICVILAISVIPSISKFFIGKSSIVSSGDCVKIKTTCCPCNNGGEEKCVLKEDVLKYNEGLKSCPGRGELICATVFNCKNNICKYDSTKKECVEVPVA